jgi:hypothetical protein
MPKSTTSAASSTKSSVLSGKGASLKNQVKQGAKALTRPFKKIKTSLSTSTSRSTALPASDHETNIPSQRSSSDSGDGGGSGDEAEVQLSPEDRLGMCFWFWH